MKRLTGLLGLLLVLMVLPVSAQSELNEHECPFELPANERAGETVRCGTLTVPEDRADPNSRPIDLAYAILLSRDDDAPDDPLVYLEGGPGGSALAGLSFWWGSSLREIRDIILLDQRGTGFSRPSLDCTPYETGGGDYQTYTQQCRDALREQNINLSAYHSAASAADVRDLLNALDRPAATLMGVSYGTRVALTVARDYPQAVRALILDAVYPPQVNGLDEQVVHGYNALEALFEACAADADCQRAYPDLRGTFLDMIERLNANPGSYYDSFYEEELDMTGDDMVNVVFGLLYDELALPYLPAIIAEAAEREFETYVGLLDGELGVPEDDDFIDVPFVDVDDDSEGAFLSVLCHEETPFNDPRRAQGLAEDLPAPVVDALLPSVALQFEDCAIWNVTPADLRENEPVVSEVPTLILSGQFDPITPATWGKAAAAHLPNSLHLTLPGMGHGTVDYHPCPTQIALAFLENPRQRPDTSCIDTMSAPAFITP